MRGGRKEGWEEKEREEKDSLNKVKSLHGEKDVVWGEKEAAEYGLWRGLIVDAKSIIVLWPPLPYKIPFPFL